MSDWNKINADLLITDPPFGINFTGKEGSNYSRNADLVVDGYVEWEKEKYRNNIKLLLDCIYKNSEQALIFSGWQNSYIIHQEVIQHQNLTLQGKLYWSYNFAPACKKRPAHNVYEIFWITKNKEWVYNKRCSTLHCISGEKNLSHLSFKRDYQKGISKYPTQLPFNLIKSLIEHFSNPGDLVFDPMAGSGMVGIVSKLLNRNYILGDLNKNGKFVFQSLLKQYKTNKFFEYDE